MSSVEFTSEAVRGAKFREKLKGYHPEDVDAFLERAATALDQMGSRLAEATARAMKAETALASNSEADESVRKTLVLAQRTAEMAVNEANQEAQQIREAAEADAQEIRAAAEAEAAELRAAAEHAQADAQTQAAATMAAADEAAESRLRAAADQIEADDNAARATREELAAEAAQASADAVRALEQQERQLRADVEALEQYLADERARILDVLTTAVDRFGDTLRPARPAGVDELDVAIDREELAKGSPDPAAEDSWNFDPAVLDRPENQWWTEPEPDAAATAGAPESPAEPAAPETPAGEAAPEAAAGEPALEAPASGATWAAGLDSNEPLPEWFTSTVGAPTAAAVATEPEPDEPGDDEEPPATLLFTLEDEGRHATDEDDQPLSAAARQRKTLLGRRRD